MFVNPLPTSLGLTVKFSEAMYTVSEGAEVVALNIQRCGSFEQEVELSLTFADITARGIFL